MPEDKSLKSNENAPDDDLVVSVRGLRNQFGSLVVHDGLDLDLRRGEILGVVGGSGTGKSVLLHSIIGLHKPNAGKIEVFGRDQAGLSRQEMKEARGEWGVLFQEGALFSSLTVAQNVQVPLREYFDLSPQLMKEIAAYKIAMVGLAAHAGPKYPSEISGGMKRRAGLARALALDPDLVFLDEPTAGLDPIGAAAFDEMILSLRDTLGLTVFLVTHDLDTLFTSCDRIAVLAEKKVIVTGTVDELLAYDHPWVKDYFHGPRSRAAQKARGR
ncbi:MULTISPECIES: ABC transporter ATP-binding protein [unclassified Iodidimonas]|jgi:phospholipid/cholesterol/gamma-HCH transport system ATP-binding protein|uniref:ABC transporter ATP-binding protein n=1 Tax=unclassified Iodidimonas TaxID=2626145 RepID=UPI002482DF17|nr:MULTISPECIES: ABC transporter ATP-binding protein [unclassified Iodidimonas]